VASVQTHFVLQFFHSLSLVRIPRVSDPSVGLHQSRRSKVLVLIPPVRGTRCRAARAEDAFVHSVKLAAVFRRLEELFLRRVLVLQPRLDRFVLLVEQGHVGHEILDNIHVRKWINLGVLSIVTVDTAEAGEGVLAVDVHGTGTADPLAAGTAEGKRWIDLVLNLDEGIENHWSGLVKVNLIGLQLWLLLWLVGILYLGSNFVSSSTLEEQ